MERVTHFRIPGTNLGFNGTLSDFDKLMRDRETRSNGHAPPTKFPSLDKFCESLDEMDRLINKVISDAANCGYIMTSTNTSSTATTPTLDELNQMIDKLKPKPAPLPCRSCGAMPYQHKRYGYFVCRIKSPACQNAFIGNTVEEWNQRNAAPPDIRPIEAPPRTGPTIFERVDAEFKAQILANPHIESNRYSAAEVKARTARLAKRNRKRERRTERRRRLAGAVYRFFHGAKLAARWCCALPWRGVRATVRALKPVRRFDDARLWRDADRFIEERMRA